MTETGHQFQIDKNYTDKEIFDALFELPEIHRLMLLNSYTFDVTRTIATSREAATVALNTINEKMESLKEQLVAYQLITEAIKNLVKTLDARE